MYGRDRGLLGQVCKNVCVTCVCVCVCVREREREREGKRDEWVGVRVSGYG